MKTNLFIGFHFKTLKCTFSGVHQYFSSFFSDSALKTIDAQMLFWSVFLKPKHENIFWGVFLQKPKIHLFGGQKQQFLKLKFRFFFLRLLLNIKGSFMPIFTKEYSYLGPLEFFENDNFAARALVGGARRKFGFGLLKSYLTFGYLTCSD